MQGLTCALLLLDPDPLRLAGGWDAALARRLVRTNLLRAGVWSAAAADALALLVRA